MSFPIVTMTCDRCGLQQPGVGGSGHEYVLPGGQKLPVWLQEGWCHDCSCIQPVESLDEKHWMDLIMQVRDELASVRSASRLLPRRLEYEQCFLGYRQYAGLMTDTAYGWSERLTEALLGLAHLAQRVSAPRCLRCGGTNVDASTADDEGVRLLHPGCGGTFQAEITGDILIRGPRSVRRYTAEGQFIGWFGVSRGDT